MSHWQRSIMLIFMVWCLVGSAYAQAPADTRSQKEKDADAVFLQGESRMKLGAYEEAIESFNKVIQRFPDTETRYQAQFRMADALVSLKKEAEAMDLLQTIVNEESPDWSPQALTHIGEVFASEQKYTEAFRAYRQIISDYPESPMVDHAHFAIGVTHFKLGHFELAAQELDKVGTAYASSAPDLQRVSPGDPLYIRLAEPNMVARTTDTLQVSIVAKSGDKENITLFPEIEGGDRFAASIQTELGAVKAGDGILQMHGDDTVTLSYKSRYVGDGAENKTITMTAASTGRLMILDNKNNEVRGVVLGDAITVEVRDTDCDVTDQKDTVVAVITTKKKDSEKITLTETGEHTGVFHMTIPVIKGEPTADSGRIESNADLTENAVTQLADEITIKYTDNNHLNFQVKGAYEGVAKLAMFMPGNAQLVPLQPAIDKPDLEIKSLLYKGQSLSQIAATYRDLGQVIKATINFRRAEDQFREIMTKYANAPEVEDAMYGLYQNYVAQKLYNSAIAIISEITRRFPQSDRGSQALFELASLHVKREEYDRALAIFQGLVTSAGGTPLAEEAQYAICTTYVVMLKPKSNALSTVGQVTTEQVAVALDEFVRRFSQSERAPEALWQLVRMRNDDEDYRGAIDAGRRMVALYPDHVMTGRVMLMMGKAQYKLRDIDGAIQTFQTIIANYGAEAKDAEMYLKQLQKLKKP
ncbi:MAG: tetratricopeptide repeat protein [Armatimonadota bacterium]